MLLETKHPQSNVTNTNRARKSGGGALSEFPPFFLILAANELKFYVVVYTLRKITQQSEIKQVNQDCLGKN